MNKGERKRGRDIGKLPSKGLFELVECPICKQTRWVEVVKDKAVSTMCVHCSSRLRALTYVRDKNPSWKGGQYRKDGYIMILKPEHPRSNYKGYIKRAIVILEEKLGRYLWPNADVHHINNVRDDDRPENLMELFHDEHSSLSGRIRYAKT